MIQSTDYLSIRNCVQIDNGTARVIISTEFGPRILHYALDGGENILGWHPEAAVDTELGVWKPYGGHRLWLAPENMPISYAPDNAKVNVEVLDELSAMFASETEVSSGIQKQFTVSLAETGTRVTIDHLITNRGPNVVEYALWGLTILAPGGDVVIPNEPYAPYSPNHLLPVRTLTQWSYTDFTDSRWSFSSDAIRLRVDEHSPTQQKIGVLNKQGWAAYERGGLRFTKRADFIENMTYPDLNSTFEVYTAGSFVELETLSPLYRLAPDQSASHTETWYLTTI